MQRILITGITGFIGGSLADGLLDDAKYDVVGVARNPTKARVWESRGIEMRYADFTDISSFLGITRDVDVVVHLAGLMRFHAPWQDLFTHNVIATQALARDAMHQDVNQFIYASSTESMGPVDVIPADETAPCRPVYGYGRTKLLAEQWLRQQQEINGFPIVIIRPTGVYGPEDSYVTLSVVRAIRTGKLRLLPGDGTRYVHFTYIDDVVQGFIRAIAAGQSAVGETFIVASDDYHTYKETFAIISHLLNVPPPRYGLPTALVKGAVRFIELKNCLRGVDDFVLHTSVVEDMLQDRAYSNSKAKTHLGFQPIYGYSEGMHATIEALVHNGLL